MTDAELAVMSYSVITEMRIKANISEADCKDLNAMTDNGLLIEFAKRIITLADLKAFSSLIDLITGNIINAGYIRYDDSELTDYDYREISRAIVSALRGIKIDHAD